MKVNNFLKLSLCLMLFSSAAMADVSLTVYQRDLALIHDTRTISLDKGFNRVAFDNIAPQIQESTLRITARKGSGLTTISQSYEYDLADQESIWKKHLGKAFSFTKDDSLYEGTLLRLDDDFIYLEPADRPGKVALVDRGGIDDMTFDAIPEGLVLNPEIHWNVTSDKAYKNLEIEISYLAVGITWEADYAAHIIGKGKVELQGNLTLTNDLEMMFADAALVLMAGDLHLAGDRRQITPEDEFGAPQPVMQDQETRFFEYRRIEVPGKMTLHANQSIGLPLIGPVSVAAKTDFFFEGTANTGEVMTRLLFANDKAAGLGLGLPSGKLLLYQTDKDGKSRFLGEDRFEASNPGDKVELLIGKAFDVRADRRRTEHQRIARSRTRDVIEIEFSSSRTETSNLTVRERLYGFWEITEVEWDGKPVDYSVESANKVEFNLELAPNSSATLRYVIEYGY
ncbi:hypothetical protein KKA00_12970 [bacterium]|nr:hypothetical protein [bacterium]MBU1653128.1 hypothetical protein [bacterium]